MALVVKYDRLLGTIREDDSGGASVVPTTRTLTFVGTTNQVVVSPTGAQDLSANRSWTLSLPQDIAITSNVTFNNVQTNGYIYNSFNSQSVPADVNGLAVSWNFSNGGAEVNLWNTFSSFTPTASFTFRQRFAGGTSSEMMRITSGSSIAMGSGDTPIITRGYDAFSSGANNGFGRWGLFMRANNLTIGIPAGTHNWSIVQYNADSTVAQTMLSGDDGHIFATVPFQTTSTELLTPTYTDTNGFNRTVNASPVYAPSGATSGRTFGLYFQVTGSGSNNFTDGLALTGAEGSTIFTGSGTMAGMVGLLSYASNQSSGTVSTAVGQVYYGNDNTSTGHVTNSYDAYHGYRNAPAFSANNQQRGYILIAAAMPTVGAFTGCIGQAVWWNFNSTSPQDGISWGSTPDFGIYRSATGTGTILGKLILTASTTSLSSLNLPSGTAPTSPVNGDMWYDGSHMYGRVNGATAQLDNQATPVVEVTSSSQAAAVNTKYIANKTTLVTITLPAAAVQGDQILIRGKGTGGWKLAQNASQTIHGASDTTTGTGGSLASQARYDCVTAECITANTDWLIINQRGTLTTV